MGNSFAELVWSEMFMFRSSVPGNSSKQFWEHICQRFNESHSVKFDVPELKKRIALLKKRYEAVETLHHLLDIGWDHKRKMVDISYSGRNWEDIAKVNLPEFIIVYMFLKYSCAFILPGTIT